MGEIAINIPELQVEDGKIAVDQVVELLKVIPDLVFQGNGVRMICESAIEMIRGEED